MLSRREANRQPKTCYACKDLAAHTKQSSIKWPAGKPHPVQVKTRSPKIGYRCHGLWTPECPRYDECLNDVLRMGWEHWICSEPGPKHHDKVLPTKELREAIQWYDAHGEVHEPF
jgi:hypothetical protein